MNLANCREYLAAGRWRFLRRLSGGITGSDVHVRPGRYPGIRWGLDHVATICLPEEYLTQRPLRLLGGALSHELLHALFTDGSALRGIAWGLFVVTNGCEDARIEHQGRGTWKGLARVVRELSEELLRFRRRSRQMAQSAETSKLYEVALSLYLLLSRYDKELLQSTVPDMPLAVAEEVMGIASGALEAPDTAAVVGIAKRILEELERAAGAVARRIGTRAAAAWSTGLASEIKQAMKRSVEEVFAECARQRYPGYWFGPWYKGRGGYSFYTAAWDPEIEEERRIAPLSASDALDLVAQADPLIRTSREHRRLQAGRLDTRRGGLVRAALGQDKRVFSRPSSDCRQLLLDVLGTLEVVLLIEAHNRYSDSEWERLREFAITLGRLLGAVGVPLVIRAWNCTRAKETVHNARTGRTWERWSSNHYINVARLKSGKERWSGGHEDRIASLPRQGFNQPLEGYRRVAGWKLELDRSSRTRVFLCLGSAAHLNLAIGNLGYAVDALREKGAVALYLDVGPVQPFYDERRQEMEAKFDGVAEISMAPEGLAALLARLLEALCRR